MLLKIHTLENIWMFNTSIHRERIIKKVGVYAHVFRARVSQPVPVLPEEGWGP